VYRFHRDVSLLYRLVINDRHILSSRLNNFSIRICLLSKLTDKPYTYIKNISYLMCNYSKYVIHLKFNQTFIRVWNVKRFIGVTKSQQLYYVYEYTYRLKSDSSSRNTNYTFRNSSEPRPKSWLCWVRVGSWNSGLGNI